MNISFRQLQAFQEVMRTGSISDAARSLHRTQPAVSSLIANLEQELGIELFERQRGKLIRKPEAILFLEEAEAILERLNHATRKMHEIGSLKQGRLNIAFMPAASQVLMPQLVSSFVADKPDVKVSLMMRGSTIIEQWIASQSYDIGLAERPAPNPALKTIDYDLACLCALRSDDPLAVKSEITAKDLSGRPLATLPLGHPHSLSTMQSFEEMGAGFNQRFEIRNFFPALHLVEQGLCYCICDPMTAEGYQASQKDGDDLVFRPFAPRTSLAISILLPGTRPASSLTKSFLSLLTNKIATIQETYAPQEG